MSFLHEACNEIHSTVYFHLYLWLNLRLEKWKFLMLSIVSTLEYLMEVIVNPDFDLQSK